MRAREDEQRSGHHQRERAGALVEAPRKDATEREGSHEGANQEHRPFVGELAEEGGRRVKRERAEPHEDRGRPNEEERRVPSAARTGSEVSADGQVGEARPCVRRLDNPTVEAGLAKADVPGLEPGPRRSDHHELASSAPIDRPAFTRTGDTAVIRPPPDTARRAGPPAFPRARASVLAPP